MKIELKKGHNSTRLEATTNLGASPKRRGTITMERCNHYTGRERCESIAVVWLVSHGGHRVPGCWYCDRHATITIQEYSAKLGEHWSTVPI